MSDSVTAACVQFCAGPDKLENIERMAPLVAHAAERGAQVVLLPEKWNAVADGLELARHAERLDEGGPTLDALSSWAAAHRIHLICGSVAVDTGEAGGVGNTSLVHGPDGALLARYQKIHLFDVEVGGLVYRESDGTAPGDEPVVADLDSLPVGLTVCYDLRFPELYRELEARGARVLTVPANFTLLTGMAHWEPLLRARAIENQCFVLAAGQHGNPGGGRKPSYGHSMIIDPWGTVLAQAADGDGVVVAELDLAGQRNIRTRLPALQHRRIGLSGVPGSVA